MSLDFMSKTRKSKSTPFSQSMFSENHVFCKKKSMSVYGLMSLILDFKLTQENDDLLSSREKQIFTTHCALAY